MPPIVPFIMLIAKTSVQKPYPIFDEDSLDARLVQLASTLLSPHHISPSQILFKDLREFDASNFTFVTLLGESQKARDKYPNMNKKIQPILQNPHFLNEGLKIKAIQYMRGNSSSYFKFFFSIQYIIIPYMVWGLNSLKILATLTNVRRMFVGQYCLDESLVACLKVCKKEVITKPS